MLHLQQLNVALLEKVKKKKKKLIRTKEFSRCTKGVKKKKVQGTLRTQWEALWVKYLFTNVGVCRKVHHNKLACFISLDAKICSVIDSWETNKLFL